MSVKESGDSLGPPTETTSTEVGHRWSTVLGFAGLIPFAASSALVVADVHSEFALRSLLAYGAVILSFVGAVHWGWALRGGEQSPRAFVTSVLPSLLGWVTLLMLTPASVAPAISLQMAGFSAWLSFERRQDHLPAHYRRLRLRLTTGVLILLGIALAGVVLR